MKRELPGFLATVAVEILDRFGDLAVGLENGKAFGRVGRIVEIDHVARLDCDLLSAGVGGDPGNDRNGGDDGNGAQQDAGDPAARCIDDWVHSRLLSRRKAWSAKNRRSRNANEPSP